MLSRLWHAVTGEFPHGAMTYRLGHDIIDVLSERDAVLIVDEAQWADRRLLRMLRSIYDRVGSPVAPSLGTDMPLDRSYAPEPLCCDSCEEADCDNHCCDDCTYAEPDDDECDEAVTPPVDHHFGLVLVGQGVRRKLREKESGLLSRVSRSIAARPLDHRKIVDVLCAYHPLFAATDRDVIHLLWKSVKGNWRDCAHVLEIATTMRLNNAAGLSAKDARYIVRTLGRTEVEAQ